MKKNYRENRYPNGYAEKIGYWQYKMTKAIEGLDAEGVQYAASRLEYFIKRQNEVYGRIAELYND